MLINRNSQSPVCITLVFAIVLAILLAGCGGGEPPRDEDEARRNYRENVKHFGHPSSFYHLISIIAIAVCTVARKYYRKKKKLPKQQFGQSIKIRLTEGGERCGY